MRSPEDVEAIERVTRKVKEFTIAAATFKEAALRLSSRFGSKERKDQYLNILAPVLTEVMEEAQRLMAYAKAEVDFYNEK